MDTDHLGDFMADWTGGATGAISGASAGATVAGPVGAVAGGVIGGVAGLFGNKKKKKKKLSAYDKQQQKLYEEEHQALHGEGPFADLYNYDPEAANDVFNRNVADPAYRKYKEDLAPGITGQFRSQGLMNSSYVGDALTKLARDIQENIDAKRAQYMYDQEKESKQAKRQAIQNIQGRQTFAYDTAAQSGGFDINKVLDSISPEMLQDVKNYFGKKQGAKDATSSTG